MGNQWPEGKKCGLSLCFDVDANTIWKLRAADYPNGSAYIRSLSIGDYGVNCGVETLLDVLDDYQLKATFFVPAAVMKENRALIQKIARKGHEIGHHGYGHEYDYGQTLAEQQAYLQKCQDEFVATIGYPAVGFRPTGRLLPEMILALQNQKNSLYLITEKGRETPYYKKINQQQTTLVELPARIELDDYYQLSYNFYPPQPGSLDRIASYEDVLFNLQREIDGIRQYDACLVTAFHPQVLGTPGKVLILRKWLDYITSFSDIWIGPCRELASWWKQNNSKD